MDRGGMTRRRAYQWLTAVLFVVLLIVIFIVPARRGRQSPETAAADLPPEVPPAAQLGHNPSRMGVAQGSASYERAATVGGIGQHPVAQAEPVSPPDHIFRKEKRVVVELNSADSLDLVQLYNIGPAFARRILKYRNLLGGYISKEQLWEVYGMDSVRYNDIAPYVTVNPQVIVQMDLNSATLDQLKHHPYLDYYQAKAIVRLREQAGLFQNVQDLLKVPIIDNETYTKIKPYLTCNSQQNK